MYRIIETYDNYPAIRHAEIMPTLEAATAAAAAIVDLAIASLVFAGSTIDEVDAPNAYTVLIAYRTSANVAAQTAILISQEA